MYAEQLILGTGQYGNAYCTWMTTPPPKMYQQLKTHFTAKYQLINCMRHMTRASGYHEMNLVNAEGETKATTHLEEAATQFAFTDAQ
eukprot:6255208-Ditylum_brightwellii.AAC.1